MSELSELSERPSVSDAFYRSCETISAIPEHVKWYVVSLLEHTEATPGTIAGMDLPFGKNRWGRVSLATVYRIRGCFDRYGEPSEPEWAKDIPSANRMPAAAEEKVKMYIESNSALYLEEIRDQLEADGHGTWALSSVFRAIERWEFTWKVLHRRAKQRDDFVRARFLEVLWKIDPNDLIFFDECGCDRRNTRRMRGRSLRGLPAVVAEFFGRGERVNIIGACDVNGFIAECCMAVTNENVNGPTIREWARNFLLPYLLKCGPGKVVVADNARIHHVIGLEAICAEAGCQVLWLPAYSPDFNPIEEGWHDLKQWIRRHRLSLQGTMSEQELVVTGLENVGSTMRAHFQHCHVRVV
jgi:transposase